MSTNDLQLQIARDHLVQCQLRLAESRRLQGSLEGLAWADAVIETFECESGVLRALDFVWAAQGCKNSRPGHWLWSKR